jgi:CheY-like chemotaxis protein
MSDSPAILVADDSADDVELLRRAFGKAGFGKDFHAVCGGAQVIEYLAGEGEYADRSRFPFPRLILLDFKMRGISGSEVLRWIRARPEFKRLPVIVFTGSEYTRDINEAYDLGANSYLVKPHGLDELLAAVKQIGEFWLRVSKLPGQDPLSARR